MPIKSRNRPVNNVIPIYKEVINAIEDRFGLIDHLGQEGLNDFYKKIKEGTIKDDLEAKNNYELASLDKEAFKRLKIKFKNKLLQKVLVASQSKKAKTPYTNTFFRLNLEYAAFNVLRDIGNATSASYFGELIVTNSIKYQINNYIVQVSTYLVEHFSIFDFNEEKAEYYTNVSMTFSDYISIEHKIHLQYSKMMSLYVKEFSPGEKALEIADHVKKEFTQYVGNIQSVYFHIYFHLIIIFSAYSQRNFKEMDECAKRGHEFMKCLAQKRKPLEYVFLRRRIEANLLLGNHDFCKNLLGEMLIDLTPGHNNWFNTLEIISTLHIHEKEYSNAIIVFFQGRKNKSLETVRKLTKTRWGLLEAYVNFLQLAGVAPETPTMSRYRINRFINDTPQYSEDKKGRNIQVIIAQLLFYIIDKNWDKMEEKIDALQKYGTRYLRKNELFRSQVFIKMLLEIPRRMYHPQAIIRHTAKYRKRLEEMAPNIDLNGSTLEIIPYEHLWELIIQNIVPPKYTRQTKLTTIQSKRG